MNKKMVDFNVLCELIRDTKYEWANGVFTIGQVGNRLSFDTLNNKVFKEEGDSWKEVATGTNKKNGYLYAIINIDGKDKILAIHTTVCMLANGLPDKIMIANHKDNCPWNNAPANLEWTTASQNIIHGRVVKSIHKNFPNIYTHLESRGIKQHIILNDRLSIEDIEKFLTFKPKGYFSVKRNEDYINPDKILEFTRWMGW